MDSLFTSLQKYRPRENSNPLENFVTEAFAWLLRKDSELSRHLIGQLSEKMTTKGKDFTFSSRDVTWSTQENYDGVFPDMEARWSGITLVFEHKVDAPLHAGQLESYRSFHKKRDNDYRLILITRHHSQHAQNPDLALCWYEIYAMIKSYVSGNQLNEFSWVIKDFLQLLKSEGLGPAAPISHNAISHYQEAITLRSQLEGLINRVSKRQWPLSSDYHLEVRNKEGVIGIQFYCNSSNVAWSPGIFVGFVLDGGDHLIDDRLKDGLKMCLNLSISKKFHEQYANWSEYTDLVNQLADRIQASTHDWVLYNHVKESRPFNAWHPLYLEYSMLELFKGTEELKEQEERFVLMAEDALNILKSSPAFHQLKNKLSK